MYDAKDEDDLQKWKDKRHPWTSPGTAPVHGNGCGVQGGNPFGCNCKEEGINFCYGDDDRAYGSCCGKVGKIDQIALNKVTSAENSYFSFSKKLCNCHVCRN